MKSQSILAGAFALAVFSLSVRGASAQAPSPQTEYRSLVEQGLTEYSAKNFAEARSLFTRAVEIYPSARALRGLGMAEFELRNYGDCAGYLQRSLDSNVEPLDLALREQTQQLLARAKSFVARVQVAVEPSAATVVVDGMPVQLGQQGNLVLEVGDHVIEFRADGYVPEKRMLKVKGGEDQALRIALPPSASPLREDGQAEALTPVAAWAQKRWFFVPRITLLFPAAIRYRSEVSCSGNVSCDVTNSQSPKHDRNAGIFLGGDVLYSPFANFRIGLGVHLQLNQIEQDANDGTKEEYGRALWVPLVTEYHLPIASRISLPLRGMFGFGMMTGGKALDDHEDTYRKACEKIASIGAAEKCGIKASPAPGFVLGVGPGVAFVLGKVSLRTDVMLGFQSFRGAKLDSRNLMMEERYKGLLATWGIAAEL